MDDAVGILEVKLCKVAGSQNQHRQRRQAGDDGRHLQSIYRKPV